jgi:hypothetical protein
VNVLVGWGVNETSIIRFVCFASSSEATGRLSCRGSEGLSLSKQNWVAVLFLKSFVAVSKESPSLGNPEIFCKDYFQPTPGTSTSIPIGDNPLLRVVLKFINSKASPHNDVDDSSL